MKKKAVIWVIIGCVMCLFVFGYFGAAYYFSKHFYPNTTINKIDVSGKSLLDATKQFEEVIEKYTLTIGDEGWYSIQTDKRNSVDVGIKIAA